TVNVTGTAVDHSNASFSSTSDVNQLTINLGSFKQATGTHTSSFSIANLLSASGLTAGLDFDSFSGTGNTSQLFTNLATFSSLSAGSVNPFIADISTSTAGTYSAEYTLKLSDQNIPGATSNTNLILDLPGSVFTGQHNLTWSGSPSSWDTASSNWTNGSAQF